MCILESSPMIQTVTTLKGGTGWRDCLSVRAMFLQEEESLSSVDDAEPKRKTRR